MRRRPRTILRLRVAGPGIRPGRIPIPDLLVICGEAQSAVTRQAEAMLGGKSLRTGPARETVRAECTLDLFAIGKGSATMSFAQPESNQTLQQELNDVLQEPLDIQRLSEVAVREVVQSIQEIKKGDIASVAPGVIRSLQGMGALLSNGVTSIEWIMPRAAGRKRTSAVFDRMVYERIVPHPKETEQRKPIQLDGILEMADFKESDLKCSMHMAGGYRATCSFDAARADDVYAALRHLARITGTAVINRTTKRPEDVRLTSVIVLDPFLANADAFFKGLNLEQLARAQGVDRDHNIDSPRDVWPENDDIDAFLADIYSRRA